METRQSDQFFEDKNTANHGEEAPKPILTISAIAFDFDFVTFDQSKSRADEIRVLFPKNKKPPRNSKEGKPGGFGLPTGQLESKESMLRAVERETRDETGCSVKRIIGKIFVVNKLLKIPRETNPENLPNHLNYDIVPNEIHIFLVEASDVLSKVREVDEIDGSVEPWTSLRQVFKLPFAQDRNGGNKNVNGIYFSHLKRLYGAIESMVYFPEELIDGETIKQWLKPNRRYLISAMADLQKEGLLDRLLPPEELQEEEVSA